jgi:hypothetical protein
MTKSLASAYRDVVQGVAEKPALTEETKSEVKEDSTANQQTLKPGTKHSDPGQKLSPAGEQGAIQDLGGNTPQSVMQPGPAKAADKMKSVKGSKLGPGVGYKDPPKKLSGTATKQEATKTEPEIAETFDLTDEDVALFESLSDEEFDTMIEMAQNGKLTEEGEVKFEAYLALVEEASKEEELAEDEESEEEISEEEATDELPIEVDLSADVAAIFNGEELSEEFQAKVTTIFEAAVVSRLKEYQTKLEEAFEAALGEHVEKLTEELTAEVDEKLDYMIEEWTKENEVALVNNVRSELAEEFMTKFVSLVKESYVDLPDDKADLFEGLRAELADVKSKLDEQLASNAKIKKEINEHKSEIVLYTVADGLTDVQTEKLRELSEGVQYVNDGDYSKKLEVIKENYFTKKSDAKPAAKQLDEAAVVTTGPGEQPTVITEELNPNMRAYSDTLSRLGRFAR